MSIIEAFRLGKITLNEARKAFGLEPDVIWGNQHLFELLPPIYVEKELEIDEYLSQFDDFDQHIHTLQQEVEPLFEEEWIRFIRNLRINLLSSIHQKALNKAAKKKLKKRLQDKVRRETKTLTDLLASHIKRLHDPMFPFITDFFSRLTRKLPRQGSFEETYMQMAKEEAERVMSRYMNQINDLIADAEEESEVLEKVDAFWKTVEKRARMVSQTQTVRLANQILLIHYKKYGFTEKVWKAEKDACPYCKELNGQIIHIDDPFFSEDQLLQPNGMKPMAINATLHHPPLHPNCRCTVLPVMMGREAPLPNKPQDLWNKPISNTWRKPLPNRRIRNYRQLVKRLLAQENKTVDTLQEIGALLQNEIERRYEKIYQEYEETLKQVNAYLSKGELTEEEEIKKNELLIKLFRQERRKEERLKEIRLRVLSQFQEFGYRPGDQRLKVFHFGEIGKEYKEFELYFAKHIAPYFPRSILKKISEKPISVFFDDNDLMRAQYVPNGNGTLYIHRDYHKPKYQTDLFHELMHRVEHFDRESRSLERQYYLQRVMERDPLQKPRPLSEIMVEKYRYSPNKELREEFDQQMALDAGFNFYYNNVFYPVDEIGFYEILSVGSEVLFGANGLPPVQRRLIEGDVDYINFLLGWWVSTK